MKIYSIPFYILLVVLVLSTFTRAAIFLVSPDGEKIGFPDPLPKGYAWIVNGSLLTPQNLRISPEGNITHGEKELAKSYSVVSDPLVLPDNNKIIYESSEDSDIYNKDGAETDNLVRRMDEEVEESGALVIPESFVKTHDLAFLDGCWRSDAIKYYTDPRRPYNAPAEFCFKTDGSGTFYAFPKGTECTSEATASFEEGTLWIETSKGSCKQKSRFLMPRTFTCEGTGRRTACYTIARYKGEVYKDEAVFHRK